MFNEKYPDRHMSRSTVSKLEKRETCLIKNIQIAGRPKVTENVKVDYVLIVKDNPQLHSA